MGAQRHQPVTPASVIVLAKKNHDTLQLDNCLMQLCILSLRCAALYSSVHVPEPYISLSSVGALGTDHCEWACVGRNLYC